MADPHVLTALIKRRSEIAGQIEYYQDSLRQAIVDLDNVDHTIRLFDPEIDLVEIRPKPVPPRNQAYQGEMTRVLLSVLRRATGPLTAYQLTHSTSWRNGACHRPISGLPGRLSSAWELVSGIIGTRGW